MEYLIDLLKKKCMEDAKLAKYSKYNQSTSSVPSNNSSENILSKSSNLSVDEHRRYIIDTLNNWCENSQSKFNLLHLSLVENQHYFISLFNDSSGALKGDIIGLMQKYPPIFFLFYVSSFY